MRQRDVGSVGDFGHDGKIFGGQRKNRVIALTTAHFHFAVLQFEGNRRIAQLGNDVIEQGGGNRDRAVFGNLRGNHAANRGIEIGRGEFELVVFGFEQNVAQNRQRVARRNRATRHAQRICQISALASDFHRDFIPQKLFCRPILTRNKIARICFQDASFQDDWMQNRVLDAAVLNRYSRLSLRGSARAVAIST